MPDETPVKGWKTKTAAVLTMVYGISGIGLYYIAGHEVQGALPPMVGLAVMIGGLGVFGLGDKLQKIIDALKGK